MKIFCKHHWRVLSRYHSPEIQGHLRMTEYEIMCDKCYRHKTVSPYQLKLILAKQKFKEESD